MDPARALLDPARRGRDGVVLEHGLAVVVALVEADGAAAAHIDGGDDLHHASPGAPASAGAGAIEPVSRASRRKFL